MSASALASRPNLTTLKPFHGNVRFGPAPRRVLSRAQRTTWRAALWQHWRQDELPAKWRDVGLALEDMLHPVTGQLDPSYATIAAAARCSVSTAQRACKHLRELGLLRWTPRASRVSYFRSEQISNAFTLHFPGEFQPVHPELQTRALRRFQDAMRRRYASGGQKDRVPLEGINSEVKKEKKERAEASGEQQASVSFHLMDRGEAQAKLHAIARDRAALVSIQKRPRQPPPAGQWPRC